MNKIKSDSFLWIFSLCLCAYVLVCVSVVAREEIVKQAMWNHIWLVTTNTISFSPFQVFKGKTILGLITWPNHREKWTKLSAVHPHTHNQGWQLGICCPKDTLMHERWQGRCYIVRNKSRLWAFQWRCSSAVCPWCYMAESWPPLTRYLAIFRPGVFVKPDWVHALWYRSLYLLPNLLPSWSTQLPINLTVTEPENTSTNTYTNVLTCHVPQTYFILKACHLLGSHSSLLSVYCVMGDFKALDSEILWNIITKQNLIKLTLIVHPCIK